MSAPPARAPRSPLGGFLAHVRRLVVLDEDGARTLDGGDGVEAVRLLTMHAAKGLEFPVVYVPNLANGRFPHQKMWDAAPPPPGLVDDVDGAAEGRLEETCLFFVAISRAKSELVLSRASRYGKRNYAPSPFLDLLESFFDSAPPAYLHWPAAAAPFASDDAIPHVPATRRRLRVWEVELYRRCPRRYEYQLALSLPECEEELGYKRFHDSVYLVISRLRHGEGGAPAPTPTAEQALAALDEVWDIEGPVGHAYEALYRAMAERLVVQFCEIRAASADTRAWTEYLDVSVSGVVVRVPIDASEVTKNGAVRIIRTRTGRPKDDDRKDERLSLLRVAAAEQYRAGPVSIELEYLGTGETVVVRPAAPRYERQRVGALEDAVAGILSGAFPAQPREPRDCLRCPYWVVCPS